MLAGCSSSLLSPRHTTKPSTHFQACHFPSMSTQNLACNINFPRKDPNRAQPVKPVRPVSSLSIDNNPIEARTSSCSLKHNVARTGSKGLKRLYQDDQEESFQAKRKRGCSKFDEFGESGPNSSLAQLGSGNFWCPVTSLPISLTPSNVIQPNFTTSPWSFVNELADLGETGQRAVKETSSGSGSRSNSSPESHQSLNLDPQEPNPNGVGPPNPNQSLDLLALNNQTHEEQVGFELITSLLACLEAISNHNIPAINHFISKLGELASPQGDLSITRLASYYTEALAIRVSKIWPNIFHITTPRDLTQPEEQTGPALHILNQTTPIPKFIHFTSNEILLRAFESKDKVHIIDFDIKQGLQWPSFFQSLASRTNPPSHVRITAIGESKPDLLDTGARLSAFAEALNLAFEFHPVVDRLEDIRLWMLHVKEGETVGVNCAFQLHKLLYDHTGNTLKDFIGLIKSTNANIVVVAEQETEHNDDVLENRVSNSLKYYSAIFDCIDYFVSLQDNNNNNNRVMVEELFGREIRNIIACEGLERFERHMAFDKWWRLMTSSEVGGLVNAGVNDREFVQSRMILKMYGESLLKVEKKMFDGGGAVGITLSWADQPLYTVSVWAPAAGAGASAGAGGSTSYKV